MIYGNIQGVRQSALDRLETLYALEIAADEFAPVALIEEMAAFTQNAGRELSVYIRRDGTVLRVTVGDQNTVSLESVHLRRNENRLAGVRCIHTHPGGNAILSDVDVNSLKRLRLDAMAAIGVRVAPQDGETQTSVASALACAILEPENPDGVAYHGPFGIYQIPQADLIEEIRRADVRITGEAEEERLVERCILVGLCPSDDDESLKELARLTETAGADVVMVTSQNRAPDNATYIGSGKAKELALTAQALDCDLIIFNDELTGAQIRNLEEILGVRVVDRAALILDIFAGRARSREGKLQVELAQLQYRLPRLVGSGVELSRLGGGIGTRGPGESKLEIDRRRIREKITEIKREIAQIGSQRAVRRSRRENGGPKTAALVGYTNAGKSTLLNRLTGADAFAEDKLFATLDTTTRSLVLPGGATCLLTDTVGFIDKLPHDLVDAFRSTLEEALYADVLVIVSDCSSPNARRQMEVVNDVLAQLGAADKPRVIALNKSDIAPSGESTITAGIPVSAKTGEGLDNLLHALENALNAQKQKLEIFIPYEKSNALAYLHREGGVLAEAYEESGTRVSALLDPETHAKALRLLD